MAPQITTTSTATRHTILVADDDPDVRCIITTLLASMGPMIEACDGAEALELARRHRPAVLVCDAEMPRLRGRGVVEAMKLDPDLAKIPIILTSGYPEPDVLGDETRIAAFLPKPFSAHELLDVVQRTLRGVSAECYAQQPLPR